MSETIKVNGEEHRLSDLSEEAASLVRNIRVCESELHRHEAQMAIIKTARATYLRALETLLGSKRDAKRKGN